MLIHEESNSVLLRVKQPALIQAVIPKSKKLNVAGHNLAVRFGVEEVKILSNMGISVPSPILYNYKWPGKFKNVLAHQKHTAAMLTLEPRAFVLNETGTMKTASALWAADYLMTQGLVHRVLICAKLSTLDRVWMEEIFSVLMHRSAVVLHDTREKRLEKLARPADFYIINHEGVGLLAPEIAARKDIDLIIYDEASELRNAGTNKYKILHKLLKPRHRVWLLTATPCPNAPTDAWALARLISPSRVPEYFSTFKRMTMLQVSQYKWVPRKESAEMAYNAMQPAVRYRKKDCLDLPPVVTEERTCELSKAQVEAYNNMRNHLILEKAGKVITAVNAADKINKLRQILCGAVKHPDTGNYVSIDHKPRLQVLLDCISEAAAKVLVIIPFKGILRYLESEVSQHYTCGVLNGDVSRTKRNEIITAFKTQTDPHVLLCHPEVMAHGLNLTEADMCIFYAPIYSNDDFTQVVERINRPGQVNKMTIIRIGARAVPLEWSIYKLLDNRQAEQESILDLYHKIIS